MNLLARIVPLIALLSISAALADEPKDDPLKQDSQKLQGKWQVIKWVDGGEQAKAEDIKGYTFEFKDDHVTLRTSKEDEGARFSWKLDPSKKPKWIDFDFGPESGLGIMGAIYRLEDEELTICIIRKPAVGKPGPRPTEFKAVGNKDSLFTLMKIKK